MAQAGTEHNVSGWAFLALLGQKQLAD